MQRLIQFWWRRASGDRLAGRLWPRAKPRGYKVQTPLKRAAANCRSPLQRGLYLVATGFSPWQTLLAALLAMTVGCANTPGGAVGAPPRQLILEITVDGVLSPNYFYYLALDFSGDESRGPIPIVGPPWGNGWGTGSITHYVRLRGSQAEVYRIQPDTNLLEADFLGRPFDYRPPVNDGTATVTLDLDTLLPRASTLTFINVNFIATDRVDVDPRFLGPKLLDAFGDGGNRYIPIEIQTNRVYTNLDFTTPIERRGDVLLVPDGQLANNASLDIVNWRIEVRR